MTGAPGRMFPVIVAAADGSSLSNPGPTGWAWFIDEDHWAAGGWPYGTNNMGELKAVLDLLQQTAVHADQPVRVLCDSQYTINALTKWLPGWKRRGWRKADGQPVLNVDLLKELDTALHGRQVTFEWVKGHAGHPLNEAADKRARDVATAFKHGTEAPTGPGYRGSPKHPGRAAVPAPVSSREAGLEDLFSLAGTVSDERPEAVRTVIALEKSLLTDEVRSSVDAIGRILHQDFVHVGPSGRVRSRGRFLASVSPFAEPMTFTELATDQLNQTTVLLRWRSGNSAGCTVRVSLWLLTPTGWQLRFHQATPCPNGD